MTMTKSNKIEHNFERFLIFLILFLFCINFSTKLQSQETGRLFPFLMTMAKSNKIELSEELMVMWRLEQTLWDVMSALYQDKNEKRKSLKRMSDKFQIF